MTTVYLFGAIVAFGLGAVFYLLVKRNNRIAKIRQLNTRLFLIRIPPSGKSKDNNQNQAADEHSVKKEIALFEQLLNGLSDFRRPFAFEAAVPHIGEEIRFYASVPWEMEETFVRQFYSLWPSAKVEPAEEYNIFNHTGTVSGAWIKTKLRFLLPIRTYAELEIDTFSAILGGLTKVNEFGEGGAIQIIFQPATSKVQRKEAISTIKVLKEGWKLKDVLAHPLAIQPSQFVDALSGKKEGEDKKPVVVDEAAVKAIEAKVSKPFFNVNVRLIASAESATQADEILGGMTAGFGQFFESPERNALEVVKPKAAREIARDFSFRRFNNKQTMLLNTEEAASVFHIPTSLNEIPKIHMLKSKQAAPPPAMPKEGVLVGESSFRNEIKKIFVSDEDRRRHIYIIGQTGTGKSTLITNMATSDIMRGKGVAIVDPHGDLVETILRQIPPERAEDVILLDPYDLERPVGLNMIEHNINRPEERTFIVNELVSILDKLYDLKTTGGPMFEQYVRNALLLLMEDEAYEPATIMEIPRVFTDPAFRKRKLERIKNPTVIDFWQKEAEKAGGDAALANITPYITSKFNNFTANDYMRVIIGQERSSIRFREIMDEGKILLVNLSKGSIGEINSKLLGMIVVGKILMAALSRATSTEENRREFNLYIDEFQNFTTESIATILSEARKYRLSLVIAHQFIGQLSDPIRNAVFGNVGSMISFRVGIHDAEVLVKEFAPVFNEHDLTNIDNFNAYVKFLVRGETTRPFNVHTLPGPAGDPKIAEAIRQLSRMTYGRDRKEVEESIFGRLRN